MTPRPDSLPGKVVFLPTHRPTPGASQPCRPLRATDGLASCSAGRPEARKSAPHIDLDRIARAYDGPLDLVELYREGLKQPSAIRAALSEFIGDVRAKPGTAAACALLGLVAGLAVTFGLAELLIVAGVGR